MDINKIFNKKTYYSAVRSKLRATSRKSYIAILPIELYNLLIDYLGNDVKIFTQREVKWIIYNDMHESLPNKFLEVDTSNDATYQYFVCGKENSVAYLLQIVINNGFISFKRSSSPTQMTTLDYIGAIIFREKLKLAMKCSEIIKKFEKEFEFI